MNPDSTAWKALNSQNVLDPYRLPHPTRHNTTPALPVVYL